MHPNFSSTKYKYPGAKPPTPGDPSIKTKPTSVYRISSFICHRKEMRVKRIRMGYKLSRYSASILFKWGFHSFLNASDKGGSYLVPLVTEALDSASKKPTINSKTTMGYMDTTNILLILVTVLMSIEKCGGGWMHHMMKMKKMHDSDHHEKSIKFQLKAIPIPIPVAYAETPAPKEKPWPAESKMKGMMWDMMQMHMMKMKMKTHMKMKMMKGMKGMKSKGCCCPAPAEKAAGWPMMPMMPAMMPAVMCPQMMMNQCDMGMMTGWPMKAACPPAPCPPPEEPEVETEDPDEVMEWPEYYDQEQQEEMNGWDSNLLPVVVVPNRLNLNRRRGDDIDEVLWAHIRPSMKRNNFDYDFDY
ncbi:hypothetical protein JTE90_004785 [Oedothorax gibbosus]|uniref:Uncharacterized protein n=1 Tax=Oedothorax gibbosus TaxID=931172 RepID=A0AAV6VGI6_9ARAC|nr:hypothetical protein JTE90_004785 [Oedothorax gibbosus]